MSEEFVLNHPWKIYLREPASSYTNYHIYYKELIKLYNFTKAYKHYIEELKDTDACLTIKILGTPMEAALQNKSVSTIYEFQWQQLFPKYVYDFIKHHKKLNNNINVNIIIISPDDIFMDENYKEPLFTVKCEDYKFTKVQNREYIHISDNLTIKINIFTCPYPQLETNIKVIEQCNVFINKYYPDYKIKSFAPSEEDIEFIKNFYEYLEEICKNPKSNLIINSFAVFRNVREFDNYGLFPTLLEVANKYKIIATEWSFNESNFKVRVVSNIDFKMNFTYFRISYVEVAYTYSIIMEYLKTNLDEIKKLKIEYNDFYKLTNEICILIKVPYKKMVYKKIIYF